MSEEQTGMPNRLREAEAGNERADRLIAILTVQNQAMQELLSWYREKRATDGGDGRIWDAKRHLEADAEIERLESRSHPTARQGQ